MRLLTFFGKKICDFNTNQKYTIMSVKVVQQKNLLTPKWEIFVTF